MKDLREFYYYIRDDRKRPMVTVCLLLSPDNQTLAKGVAICSLKDQPCKAIGRKIARARASRGLKEKGNGKTLRISKKLGLVMDGKPYLRAMFSAYYYMPVPIGYEAAILNKSNKTSDQATWCLHETIETTDAIGLEMINYIREAVASLNRCAEAIQRRGK